MKNVLVTPFFSGEPCSTSILDGLKPLSCPTNYVCKITTEGDLQLNIPNRGECVRINEKSKTSGKLKQGFYSCSTS